MAFSSGRGCNVCAPLTSQSVPDMVAQMHLAKEMGADLVEIRLDHIRGFDGSRDLPVLLKSRPLPAIVTYRPVWEGGEYKGDEKSRLDTLRKAIELEADFVDVELQVAPDFIQQIRNQNQDGLKTKIIVSNHNYEFTPSLDEISSLIFRIQSAGADIVKFVTTAVDVTDVSKIFQLVPRIQIPTIALVMGPRGLISRLLAPKFHSFLTFGTLGEGKESAPGQPTIKDLLNVYKIQRVGPSTKIYGLIGNPVGHSKSPVLHNQAMEERGFDGLYVPFLVDDVRKFLVTYNSPDFAGFSVTIPHKQTALECCDIIDPLAKSIGAVNTLIRRDDGKLIGYNTDSLAALKAIQQGLIEREGSEKKSNPLKDRLVVVIGAGGAGRAIAFGANQNGAHVIIANRNFERGVELAHAVQAQAIHLSDLSDTKKIKEIAQRWNIDLANNEAVLANTTSVGMAPDADETPLNKEFLDIYGVVFDAVYNPIETRLLKDAKAQGKTIVSGVEMFIGQGIDQFELFTNLEAPRKLMRQVVIQSLTS